MTLFSEIYSSYYQIVYALLKKESAFSQKDLQEVMTQYGFLETSLYLLPRLANGSWNFFSKKDGRYCRNLKQAPVLPLSHLQKAWLKTLLLDRRIRLFLSSEQLSGLEQQLSEIEPLFLPEDFFYYDAFSDGDAYSDPLYQQNFLIILDAIQKRQILNINFQSPDGHRVHHWFLPFRLEYSIKNDCFRLYALEIRRRSHFSLYLINLSRITSIERVEKYAKKSVDPDSFLMKSYANEPVTLLIKNDRNALERAMLQFANYKKHTTRLDEHTYRCEIYYHRSDETELLIEVLSFGPMVKVIGHASFLEQIKERLRRQKALQAF